MIYLWRRETYNLLHIFWEEIILSLIHISVAQTVEAFRLAREEGFDNINMDLILGLPGETKEDVEEMCIRDRMEAV